MAATEILTMIEEDRLGGGNTTYVNEDIAWLPSIIGLSES